MNQPRLEAGELQRGMQRAGTTDDCNRIAICEAVCDEFIRESVGTAIHFAIACYADAVVCAFADEGRVLIQRHPMVEPLKYVGQHIGQTRAIVQQDGPVGPILAFDFVGRQSVVRGHGNIVG